MAARAFSPPGEREDTGSAIKKLRPSIYFFRAAASVLHAHVKRCTPERSANELFGRDVVTEILLRAASGSATIASSSWAGALAATSIEDTVMQISSISAFAALVQKGLKLDFGGYAYIKAPGRLVDANDGGTWVAEAAPVTVRAQRITSGALLEPRKLLVIAGISEEMAASSNIENVSRALMSEGLALKLDATAFDANAGDASRPPGLLNGLAGLTPTAGGGLAALQGDLQQLMAALVTAGAGRDPTIVTHPAQALTIKLMAGPKFDIPVLSSSALPAGTVIMIEGSSLATAFSGVPEFDVGQYPLLTFDDTSPPADPMTGQPTRSTFQTDELALRARLRCAWGMRGPHLSWLSGATW
jgi:hypothetical protein